MSSGKYLGVTYTYKKKGVHWDIEFFVNGESIITSAESKDKVKERAEYAIRNWC